MRELAKEIRSLLAEEQSRRETLINARRKKFGSDRAQAEDAFDEGKGISGRCPICNGDGVVSGRIRGVKGSVSCRMRCQVCGGLGFALKAGCASSADFGRFQQRVRSEAAKIPGGRS